MDTGTDIQYKMLKRVITHLIKTKMERMQIKPLNLKSGGLRHSLIAIFVAAKITDEV